MLVQRLEVLGAVARSLGGNAGHCVAASLKQINVCLQKRSPVTAGSSVLSVQILIRLCGEGLQPARSLHC